MSQLEIASGSVQAVVKEKPGAETGEPPATAKGATQVNPEDAKTKSIKTAGIEDDAFPAATEPTAQTGPGTKTSFTRRCPNTHKSHAHLLKFGMKKCPACGQGIFSNKNPRSIDTPVIESEESSDAWDNSSIADDREDEGDVVDSENALVKSSVSFCAQSLHIMKTISWPETFDLQESRSNLGSSDLAFEIKTTLQTSLHGIKIPKDIQKSAILAAQSEGRVSSQVDLGRAILKDPMMDIAVLMISIIVHSKGLVEIIKSVVSYYPGVNLDGKPLTFLEPFALIIHHLPQLEGILRGDDASDVVHRTGSWFSGNKELAYQQLETFVRFFKQPKYAKPIEEETARNARGFCTFRMLWHLLRPGSTAYLSRDGRLSAHVIAKVNVDPKILHPEAKPVAPYGVKLWYLDFDGRHVGRCEEFVSIPAFDGEVAITSLRIFPVEYCDNMDGGKTKAELEDMGRQWFEYLLGKQAHYKGEFMGPLGRQFDGRVFIDNLAYIEEHPSKETQQQQPQQQPPPPHQYMMPPPGFPVEYLPRRNQNTEQSHTPSSYKDIPKVGKSDDLGEGLSVCVCDDCRGKRVHPPPGFLWTDYDFINPKTTKTLELPGGPEGINHRYLLCSRRLFGFVFKSRKWEVLDVKFCSPARVQPGAIKSLVMPEDRRTTIQALVEQYNTSSSKDGGPQRKQWGADYIESKGDGQIFLLHGGPGVGKSLPLLSLNVGDIGTSESKVEERLSYWFNLAEKWGAVMLIDEADVYLERRTVSDLQRNGIVSVFLRCMEYYRGILFLTTNRIGHFDDAFVSRIHLVIHYEPLGERERRKIWTQFFQKLENERDDISITSRARNYVLHDPEINDEKWNGREIRNAFQTAVALADYQFSAKKDKSEYETAQLDQKHFQQICGMALQFKGYLNNLHGMDEPGRAFVTKARIDESVE